MRPDIYVELDALKARLEALESDIRALDLNPPAKVWYTRSEAAAYLCLSVTKLWELRSSGRLVGHQIDGKPTFHVRDLDDIPLRDLSQGTPEQGRG